MLPTDPRLTPSRNPSACLRPLRHRSTSTMASNAPRRNTCSRSVLPTDARRRLLFSLSIGLAVSLGAAVFAPEARANEPTAAEKETARTLMDQGDEAFAAKDFPTALKHYKAAHAIMGIPNTGIWVAKAEEAL